MTLDLEPSRRDHELTKQPTKPSGTFGARAELLVELLSLGIAVGVWFLAIRAPLWTDETLSYYVIKQGFHGIAARQGWPGLPAPGYYYVLWGWTKLAGTGELSLRILSVVAMFLAVYLLFRAAQSFFGPEVAIITAAVFCVHPIVIFASIDIRPYAFAMLAITSSILLLIRLSEIESDRFAAFLGLTTASILYFQMLFGAILPAFCICFLFVKARSTKHRLRLFAITLACFAVAITPLLTGIIYLFRTREAHVYDLAPKLLDPAWTVAPEHSVFILIGTLLIAGLIHKLDITRPLRAWPSLCCLTLALVPLLILFSVSVATSLHVFVFRYRLVAIPGIALCWGLAISRVNSRWLRALFSAALVLAIAYPYFNSVRSASHEHSWKYALEIAQRESSPDNAPLLICSDLIESDRAALPSGSDVMDSPLFPALSYYKVSVPIVALPRSLNEKTIHIADEFVQNAAAHRQKFLALGYTPSYDTLHWIISIASKSHTVRVLGQNEQTTGIVVLEFEPINP